MSWASERLAFGAALLVAALVLAACGDDGGTASDEPDADGSASVQKQITVPTSNWRPGDPGGRAMLQGRLDLSDPACPVVVSSDDAPTLVVWPAGTYASDEGETPALHAEDGTAVAQDGDELVLSGSADGQGDVDTDCGSAQGEVFVVEAEVKVVEG